MLKRKTPLGTRNTPDARLWMQLKAMEGYRFRRKAPFKSFILDFVEHDARLVIALSDSVPGQAHAIHITRDRLLSEQGYVILRLWKTEVARDMAGALHTIRAVLADIAAHDS